MPRQGQDFQLFAKLGKLRIRGNQRCSGAHRQLSSKAIGQAELVAAPDFSNRENLQVIGRRKFNQALDSLNCIARLR